MQIITGGDIINLPKRKQNRLSNYDYSQSGAYFITICTHNHVCSLWASGYTIANKDEFHTPVLSDEGMIIDEYIKQIPNKYPNTSISKYIIMPNHFHIILLLNTGMMNNETRNGGTENPSPTVCGIIGWFKYQTTKMINRMYNSGSVRRLQRSYHDHIIRSDKEFEKIWKYIDENPQKWELDCFYRE